MHIEDMHVVKFAQEVRKAGIKLPIILLAYDNRERKELTTNYDTSIFDRIFIWQGDYRLLIGMIKYIEDRLNVHNDTLNVGVQTIILVEDNIKFYSSYVPLIYTEIFEQSQRLISEGINTTHRFLRMRARPKILLSSTYEEAWDDFQKYKQFILGIILDINFKHNGEKNPEAGITFAKNVKDELEDIPILLQSSNVEYEKIAHEIGASFLWKESPRLLHGLREFMIEHFSFGDFVFRTSPKVEVGRANNLKSLEEMLKTIPDESILFHSERNHFSNWLKARTEFWLASKLRPRKVADYNSVTDLRNDLISILQEYQELRQRGNITDFTKENFDPNNSFARIGGGSLGGKARGLGFTNTIINNYNIRHKFKGVEVTVPSAIVIATDVFDKFMEDNNLFNFALTENDDKKLIEKFITAEKFPHEVIQRLIEFLDLIHEPLAVRSSSLLEDSQFQPFAGVYQTYMIPNSSKYRDERLEELLQTIKCVYASQFSLKAKDYLVATSYRLEEEKMAVIIQKLLGTSYDERFYPDISGVAKSYNFYPVPPQKAEDGIALVALGLGKTVVEGGNTVRFCPKYPKHLLQFFSTRETIKNAQQNFYALNQNGKMHKGDNLIPENLVQKYNLEKAEKDQTLFYVGSTYSAENDMVYDGISREGNRVVTFAPILKHEMFPLPEILTSLLELGTWGMGTHIEIEFAVNTKVPPGKKKEFAMLQMRPMVLSRESEEIRIEETAKTDLICHSGKVLGDGVINDIFDIIFVDKEKFERSNSKEVAQEVSLLNKKLLKENKRYLLIGVGRWGSLDPWLGIPVTWDQIAGASVIVESGFKDLEVTPSQGSHFFQNITSFRIGYFTIDGHSKEDFIDWEWLTNVKPSEQYKMTSHLSFQKPIIVKINGHQNEGIIIKPSVK